MNTSETIKNIADALFQFDSEVGKIGKSSVNPFFKNKYAALPDILSSIKEPLAKSGLTIKQFPEGEHQMTTIIMHPLSGEWISSTYTMRPSKEDPQGEGSRITYQRRYALGACLGLNIDIDDDGNAASEPEKEDKKPWLNDNQVSGAIKRLETGELNGATPDDFIKKIYDVYRVSKANQDKLTEVLNSKKAIQNV